MVDCLRALSARNFRLFFAGQAISVAVNDMILFAFAWLAFDRSHSAFWVGAVAFAARIPIPLLAPVAGVCADRVNRHRLFFIAQALSAVWLVALSAVLLRGWLSLSWLVAAATVDGVLNAFESPLRQVLTATLVDENADVPRAISLSYCSYQFARLIGPLLAGLMVAHWGASGCFLAAGLLCLPTLGTLAAIHPPARVSSPGARAPQASLKEGARYALRSAPMRLSLVAVACFGLLGFAPSVLAPVLTRDIFHGGSVAFGFMMSAIGLGAIIGALFVNAHSAPESFLRICVAGLVLTALSQLGLARSFSAAMAAPFFLVAGIGAGVVGTSCNILLQCAVEEAKRGRIMGLFSLGQGMQPVGGLAAGALASRCGPQSALLASGALLCGFTVWFARHRPRSAA